MPIRKFPIARAVQAKPEGKARKSRTDGNDPEGKAFKQNSNSCISIRVISAVYLRHTVRLSCFSPLGQTFDVYAPYETRLNDIVYTNYHKFGAEARMLPGYEIVPDATTSPAVNGQSSTKPPPNH